MSSPQSIQSSRSIPLLGFLCLFAGCGIFFAAPNLAYHSANYGGEIRTVGAVAGSFLILNGMWIIASRLLMKPGQSVGRLSRNTVTLPREGLVYLVIMIVAFVGSLIGRQNMLMLVFAVMAGPFIVNGGVAFTLLKKNRLTRRLPERAMAGEIVSVEIEFKNRKWWFNSWMMMVRDRVGHESHSKAGTHDIVLDPAVLFASVPARGTRSSRYQLRPTKRGRYAFGPLEVATRFPLGLVERGYVTDERGEMLVYPQIGTLAPAWHRQYRLATNFVEQLTSQHGTFHDEFHHLREYRNGDNPRDIHWRTSARVNNLMVREFHQSRDRGLTIVVELFLFPHATAAQRDAVELALSFVATACVDHSKRARGVEQAVFIAGSKPMQWRSNRGTAGLEPLLDRLAQVEGGDARELGLLIEDASLGRDSSTRFVFLTTRPTNPSYVPPAQLDQLPGVEVLHVNVKELSRYFSLESSLIGELEPVADS